MASFSSDSEESDDALSLAESLNETTPAPPPEPSVHPPIDLRKTNKLCISRLLGATNASHAAGGPRERFLLCGGGAAWSLGCTPDDPPRFIPAGIASSSGATGAAVQAASCGPGGLIVLAHEALGPKAKPTLSVWSAPAIGLQTPSHLATLACDRPLRGGASAVGFAGGHGAPFVWVAERAKAGAMVLAYDWRARSKPGGGGASIAWVPGGAGRRLACVLADGGGQDLAACGSSFLSFLSLSHADHPAAPVGARDGLHREVPNAADDGAAWWWNASGERSRATAAGLEGVGGKVLPTWEPDAPWDENTIKVPPAYAIGMQDLRHGFRFGGGFEDDAEVTRARKAMPASTDDASVRGDADDVCRVCVWKGAFAPHGEPGALRPLKCLGFEPVTGGVNAHALAGTADGDVLRFGRGRRVCASWHAHEGAVISACFAGGGTTYAATAGTDGHVRLWALNLHTGPPNTVDGWSVDRHAQSMIGEWDLRSAGLIAEIGPRVLLSATCGKTDPSSMEILLFCGHGLHSLRVHGARDWPRQPLPGEAKDDGTIILADGRRADAAPHVLLQGHRRAPHLLLAHPTLQRVLTIDEHHACLWDLDDAPRNQHANSANGASHAPTAVPPVTVTMPAAEGRPCCAAFSPSGSRWAVGLASGRVLLVDVDYDGEAGTREDASRFAGRSDRGVQRTLLEPPPHSPPPLPVGHTPSSRAVATAVAMMAFNPEEELLATVSASGLLGAHQLPRTLEQQRRRTHLLEMRPNVSRPMQFGVPGGTSLDLRAAGCWLPPSAVRVGALIWSVSSTHIFTISPAGTATPAALRRDFALYPVIDESVGAAEWPKELEAQTAASTALCNGGEMISARFVPMTKGQAIPRGAPLATPAGRSLNQYQASTHREGSSGRRVPTTSSRPRPISEKLSAAKTGGGVASVNGRLGVLDVHAGLSWSARSTPRQQHVPQPTSWWDAIDGERKPLTSLTDGKSLVTHVAWTVGERFAITGDSEQPCLCVWQRPDRLK